MLGSLVYLNKRMPTKVCSNPNSGFFVSTIKEHGDGVNSGPYKNPNIVSSLGADEGLKNPNFAATKTTYHQQQKKVRVFSSTDCQDETNPNSSQPVRGSNVQTHNINDVVKLFGVPLNSLRDIEEFVQDLQVGKHELWPLLTKEKNDEITNIVCNRYSLLSANQPKGVDDVNPSRKASPIDPNADDNLPSKVTPSDPIVQSVDINTKSTSYARAAGASAKDQPSSNFCPLVADPVFDGVNIFIPRKVVEKKWSIDTRLLKEELTRISLIATFIGKPIILDSFTSSMCNDSWGRSSFARCLIKVNLKADLVDAVTIRIPSLTGDDFTKETIRGVIPPIVTTFNVVTPTVEKTNDVFQTLKKVRYEPKASTSAPKKGVTDVGNASTSSMLQNTGTSSNKDNINSSNSFAALNVEDEEEEEVVKNVYDKKANLVPGGSSSFTATVG
ncbi:hypothetical protein Tco_0927347 [Tanacetum coccineum]